MAKGEEVAILAVAALTSGREGGVDSDGGSIDIIFSRYDYRLY